MSQGQERRPNPLQEVVQGSEEGIGTIDAGSQIETDAILSEISSSAGETDKVIEKAHRCQKYARAKVMTCCHWAHFINYGDGWELCTLDTYNEIANSAEPGEDRSNKVKHIGCSGAEELASKIRRGGKVNE